MPFVLTGRGRITDSFPQCPLSPGLLGICSSETKVRNLIAEIRVISQISANFVCISFAQYCRPVGTLIVPKWVSAPIWPILLGPHFPFSACVKETIVFTNVSGVRGSTESIVDGHKFNSHVLAVRFSAC